METKSDINSCDDKQTLRKTPMDTDLAYMKTLLSSLSCHSKDECIRMISDVVTIFLRSSQEPENKQEHLLEALKVLKSSCVKGVQFQEVLTNNNTLLDAVDKFLDLPDTSPLYPIRVSASQLVANLCVYNPDTQKIIWDRFKHRLLDGLAAADTKVSNVWGMIAYNIRINEVNHQLLSGSYEEILVRVLDRITKGQELSDFVNLLLEYYVTRGKETVDYYPKLGESEKLGLIYYMADFVKDERNKPIEVNLFRRVLGEFKRKSDVVLKPEGTDANANPREVYGLLEIVAYASCNPAYNEVMYKDASLFINLGCLLTAVHKAGKQKNSIFAPIQKLDQIAPSSKTNAQHEQEISYSLKSLLVKAIGNLMHKNRTNQGLVREMDILLTILECTNLDARNPLVKEYSIMAIRNACEGNVANQDMISSLAKVGDAASEIVSEFTQNTIRIQKSERRGSGFYQKRNKRATRIIKVGRKCRSEPAPKRVKYEPLDDNPYTVVYADDSDDSDDLFA